MEWDLELVDVAGVGRRSGETVLRGADSERRMTDPNTIDAIETAPGVVEAMRYRGAES